MISRKIFSFLVLLLFSCSQDYLPKPKGYNRIDLPEFKYKTLGGQYPFTFEYSEYVDVEKDSFNISEENWINLSYPAFDAKVHFTYFSLNSENKNLKMVLNDAVNLTAKHQIKAYGIDESVMLTPNGYTGVIAELSGEVPTQFQFFVTDSTRHFLRGALYFNTALKNDSLAPVIEYIKVDMAHLMNTLKFNP
jgi:gliding motility-associated lipoprotein GldD